MTELQFPRVGERMHHAVLENGLNVFVFPKPGFQKSYAFFATSYGGMHTRFTLDGQALQTPEGVAHFLEHKMFDTQDGNALQTLAENGASPNAFTSTDITGYYFDCTENFEVNLKTLLSFVSVPWFTPESVAKEQGIIGQEIRMTEDDPEWCVFMNLLAALYRNNPIRTSIIGTVESISHITAETLYACHKAFYDPANMVLCVAGDLDAQHVCDVAREILPKTPGPIAHKDLGDAEPSAVTRAEVSARMEVASPLFQLGFKGTCSDDRAENARMQLLGDLVCEVLLGDSSALYARLYGEGLIDKSFSYGCEAYPGCIFLVAGGQSRDPAAVREAVLAEGARLVREGIDAQLWQRIVRASYGRKVQSLNSFENLCIGQARGFFHGAQFLDFPTHFDAFTAAQAQALLADWVTRERTALSVVLPKEDAQG